MKQTEEFSIAGAMTIAASMFAINKESLSFRLGFELMGISIVEKIASLIIGRSLIAISPQEMGKLNWSTKKVVLNIAVKGVIFYGALVVGRSKNPIWESLEFISNRALGALG